MMLPQVDLPYEPDFQDIDKEYDTRDINEESYQKLEKVIKYFLEGDCWALTVDNEVVFNSYKDNMKTIRSQIEAEMVRDKILESPHGYLLVFLHRRKTNAKIRIYMFYEYTWTVNIDYVVSEDKYYISYSQSKEHKIKY